MSKSNQSQPENYLSKEQTNALKGIASCMVLICHLQANVDLFKSSIIGTVFSSFGYLAVSIFFFISGFGLYEQLKKAPDKKAYIQKFPHHRILPFYFLYGAVVLIYLVRDILVKQSVNFALVLKSFFFGGTIVDYGWYFQVQLLLYIAFFIVFTLMKKHQIKAITLLLLIYCAICVLLKIPTTWYQSVFCFSLGLLCSFCKDRLFSIKLNIPLLTTFFFMLFIITLLFGNKRILPEFLRMVIKIISSLSFVATITLLMRFLNIANTFTTVLGKYSFEIYILQGLFINGYRDIINNDILYIAAVTGSLIIASLLSNPVFKQINLLLKGVKNGK